MRPHGSHLQHPDSHEKTGRVLDYSESLIQPMFTQRLFFVLFLFYVFFSVSQNVTRCDKWINSGLLLAYSFENLATVWQPSPCDLKSLQPSGPFKRWLSFFTSIDHILEGKEKNGFSQLSYSDQVRRYDRERLFLKNPDLMAMTFSHLQVKNDKKNRRCLFNAALTCKDFLDIALDALWERLDSLLPLLKLLPALQVEDGAYICANVHVFNFPDDIILFSGP